MNTENKLEIIDRHNYMYEPTYYIQQVVSEVASLEGITEAKAFEKLIDYISVHSLIGAENSCTLKSQTAEFLDDYIDIDKLKRANCDFLGEYYFSRILQKRDLFSVVINDTINSDINKNGFPKPVFITDIRTGHKAMKLVEQVGKEHIIMYATTNDLLTYRVCQINRHLFDLPLFVLYIDAKSKDKDNIDIATNSINWTYANRWFPTTTSLLKTIS